MTLDIKDQNTIDLVEKDQACFDYFFQRAHSLKWLKILRFTILTPKENNFKFDNDGNSFFWIPLYYLERISLQIKQDMSGKEESAKEVLHIIDELVNFSNQRKNENKPPINHFHIWWYIVKIFNNIPNDLIKSNVEISTFKKWLCEIANSSMRGDLALTDLVEKVLPSFLNDSSNNMEGYAGEIVKIVTGIGPQDDVKKNSFSRQQNARLMWSDYWIKDSFGKYGKRIGEVCHLDVVEDLLNKLCCALEYHTNEQRVVLNIGQSYYKMTASRVNVAGLCYKKGVFVITVQQYTPEQLVKINIANSYEIYRTEPRGEKLADFVIEGTHDCISFVNALRGDNSLRTLKFDLIQDFDDKCRSLYELFSEDYSYIWDRSLVDVSENDYMGCSAHEILTFILRDVFLSKCKIDPEAGKKLINLFIIDNRYHFPIFGRMALLAINSFWGQYNELLLPLIKSRSDLLSQSAYKVEFGDLARNHSNDFSADVLVELRNQYDNPPQYYKDCLRKGEQKQYDYWQYSWATCLKTIEPFKSEYNRLKLVFPDISEPEIDRESMHGGCIKDISEISVEDMMKMPNVELVRYLNNFEEKREFGTLEWKTREGLADVFCKCVVENPNKYADEIGTFEKLNPFYQRYLFKGFGDAFIKLPSFDGWDKIFEFAKNWVIRASHSKEDNITKEYQNVAEEIARMLEKITSDDKKTVEHKYLDVIDRLFILIWESFDDSAYLLNERHTSVSFALNSFMGRVIYSYFIFSMHVKRTVPDSSIVKNWGRERYQRFLNDKKSVMQSLIYLGRFLPNMRFLDEKDLSWSTEVIHEINSMQASDAAWQCFMEGYLSRGGAINQDLYDLLRPSFQKGIECNVFEHSIDINLVHHITLEYLQGYEPLSRDFDGINKCDGLFELLLKDACTEDKRGRWSEIVSLMWRCTGKHSDKEEYKAMLSDFKDRILLFWDWVFRKKDFVEKQLDVEEYQDFMSTLSLLTIVLDEVNDTGMYKTKAWLKECAKYVEKRYYSSFFIEYLLKFHGEGNIRNIAEVYQEMLNHSTPTYKKEDIVVLIERIFQVDKKLADSIVATYVRKGQYFLKPLWEKYNS